MIHSQLIRVKLDISFKMIIGSKTYILLGSVYYV